MTKYLVVLLPSQQVADFIKNLRLKLNLKYSHTINPHLTLVPPFFAKEDFQANLKKIASQTHAFTIELGHVQSFPKPRKITYFSVLNHAEVSLLRSKLVEELKDFGPFREEFIPHITLAKEVDQERLSEIEQKIESDNKSLKFEVYSFYLFKKSGQVWEEVSKFTFKTL